MDLGEIRSYVSARLTASLSTDDIDDHINEVAKDLSRLFTADFIEESTALSTSTSSHLVASTWEMRQLKSVHAYIDGDRTPLMKVNKEALVYPLQSGTPKFWALWAST